MPASRRRFAGPSLVLVGLLTQDVGAALAVTVFPTAGPIGMVALRLALSALVLWALVRPDVRRLTEAAWAAATAYGLVLASMNVAFYLALDRLPLGTTVTLELLGPLTLSVVAGSGWLSVLWAGTALAGAALLGWDPQADLDPIGVALALTAAFLWACYILLAKRAGERFEGLEGLALGMSIGAVAVFPVALATTGTVLFEPEVLLVGLAVAVLSSTVPYAMEMLALRRMDAGTFSILMACSPAIAALAGFVVLGQVVGPAGYLGIGLVVLASAGATRSAAPVREADLVR